MDDNLARINDFNFFYVSYNFDLQQDLKLGTKSLSYMYLNSLFNDIEYADSYQTISFLLSEIVEGVKEDFLEDISVLMESNLSKKELIKLFTFYLIKDDLEINANDLSLEEVINTQLCMIKKIICSENKNTILLLDSPIFYESSKKILEEVDCYCLVFFEACNFKENEPDCLFLVDDMIDIADEEKLFELCENYKSYITIKDLKNGIISELFDYRIRNI